MPPTFLGKKSEATLCLMFDRNCLEGLSDSPESPPATEISVLFVGGFRFCLYVGFH